MTIILLAIIAAALIFGSRAAGAFLRQALALIGVGVALVALGLLGAWLGNSTAAGGATAGLGLLVLAAWAFFDQERQNKRLTALLADEKKAAAARLEALRSTPARADRPIEEYWTAAAIAARRGEREQPSGGTSS